MPLEEGVKSCCLRENHVSDVFGPFLTQSATNAKEFLALMPHINGITSTLQHASINLERLKAAMQETASINRMQRLLSGMHSISDKDTIVISFDDDEKRALKQERGKHCEHSSTLEHETIIKSSDETSDTTEVSESDSDLGSEHSFSITPYPNTSDHVIPTKTRRDQPTSIFYTEYEHKGLRLVRPYSSTPCLEDKDSWVDNVDFASATELSSWTKTRNLLVFVLLVPLFCHQYIKQNRVSLPEPHMTSTRDTIYVPGAGFSGFWFTLGRLQSIDDPKNNDYYCFSAGCLGVVASLRNFTVDETLDIALNIQERWKSGQIERHDVVGEFVDKLVNTNSSIRSNLRSIEESSVLERMHVITSVKDTWFGMKTQIRSPETSHELQEMLLQTTWM